MNNQLDKILRLVARTGDKFIILKDNREFIISDLDDYINLVESKTQVAQLSEAELLHKINRDIALWREAQQENNSSLITDLPPNHQPQADATAETKVPVESSTRTKAANPSPQPGESVIIEPLENIVSSESQITANKDEEPTIVVEEPDETDETMLMNEYNKDNALINGQTGTKKKINNKFTSAKDTDEFSQTFNQQLNQMQSKTAKVSADKKQQKNKKTKSVANLKSIPKKRVNNFGYLNPVDTDSADYLDQLSANNPHNLDKLDKIGYQNVEINNNYTHIPPPPDAKNS